MAAREPMESFAMSSPFDQIDNSRSQPLPVERGGQVSSDRPHSDSRAENREGRARQALPSSMTVSQRGPVTLLRLSRPAKRNALDTATIAGVETFFSDPPEATRVVVLHGG